eukprot:122538-Amphidinium_carterae.3
MAEQAEQLAVRKRSDMDELPVIQAVKAGGLTVGNASTQTTAHTKGGMASWYAEEATGVAHTGLDAPTCSQSATERSKIDRHSCSGRTSYLPRCAAPHAEPLQPGAQLAALPSV